MNTINAAVIDSFDEPPRCRTAPAPTAESRQEVVDVLAVGIHPVTRGVAAGKHYMSPTTLPAVAGTDAVVRRADGSLAVAMSSGTGTLAERIVIDPKSAIPAPANVDPAVLAATLNPALSSWVALRARVGFQTGQSVLVIGATGNAGSIAVRVAKILGASRVIAAGRNHERLTALLNQGADEIIEITADEQATADAFAALATDVDVVLDYVWGPGTELAMEAIGKARTDHVKPLEWVQIGSVGGTDITLGGHLLRHNALRISGSGFGSVSLRDAKLDELVAEIGAERLTVTPRPVPLAHVEDAWAHEDAPGERTVIALSAQNHIVR